MNCRDFRDDLHEFLDETQDATRQAAAREHLAACADCRRQVEQLRALGDALHTATAGMSLSPAVRREILATARAQERSAPATGWREAWVWIIGHPLQVLAPAAMFAIVLWFNLQLRHHPANAHSARAMPGFHETTIDVPLSSDVHVLQIRNGIVIDTVVTQVAQSQATFSSHVRGE